MVARSLTCDNIASVGHVANLTYVLYAVGTGGVVRSLVSARPFPATLPGDLERKTRRTPRSERDTGSFRGHGETGRPARYVPCRVHSGVAPGDSRPGLTQREFVESARMASGGAATKTAKCPPTGRRPKGTSFPVTGHRSSPGWPVAAPSADASGSCAGRLAGAGRSRFGLPQRCGEPRPRLGAECQRPAVPVRGVADQNRAIAASGLYAVVGRSA